MGWACKLVAWPVDDVDSHSRIESSCNSFRPLELQAFPGDGAILIGEAAKPFQPKHLSLSGRHHVTEVQDLSSLERSVADVLDPTPGILW